MLSLFNSFDSFFHLFPKAPIFVVTILSLSKIFRFSLISSAVSSILQFFNQFFYSLSPRNSKMFILMVSTMLMSILFFNFLSVGPFTFPMTSGVNSVSLLSLICCLTIFSFTFSYCIKSFLSHSVPEGTPMVLVVFIFLIELISFAIRPLTLMVRLTANILAGHLLMILLSQLVFLFPTAFQLYIGLNMVEFMVSMIQSYIFVTMVYLYFSEVW